MSMKSRVLCIQRAADSILAAVVAFDMVVLRVLARASQPAVMAGLTYWLMLRLGYPVMLPWWDMAWPMIQATAITTHLAILPIRAVEQAKAGERAELAITIISIIFLVTSSIPFFSPFDTPTFTSIRLVALLSILFTEEHKPRCSTARGIPINSDEDEDEDDEHPFGNPIRVQD